ncbi:hypothetical protein DEO72_LG6g30 [Vigna unguiculata]|uniref:Uncharacterized protein n=1 Tax=Vigna unguiculata TaxID=3917 RepID=A0A4D6M437_VIGUN|nr:hypothetical protein DEO72_LG6g30 [Vigna unguiculata]
MDFRNFDPRHTGELLKHIDRQNEVLMEAYRSMFHELRKLQVEEEMLMRKMHEVMSTHGLTKMGVSYGNPFGMVLGQLKTSQGFTLGGPTS